MSEGTAKRRWFRFSLATMFVVVTVFGCWLGLELRFIHERREFREIVDRALSEVDGTLSTHCGLTARDIPQWRTWLGDTPEVVLVLPAHWPDAELDRARFLFPEAWAIYRESDSPDVP